MGNCAVDYRGSALQGEKNARVMTKCNLVTSKLHNNVNMVNTAKMYM